MTTPINASSLSAKSSQIQNADGTPIYNATTGEWALKNASNVTTFAVNAGGTATSAATANTAQAALTTSNQSVANISTLSFTNAVGTINGLSGGIEGQLLYLYGGNPSSSVTLAHNNAGGTQKFLCPSGTNLTITGGYGGCILMFRSNFWMVVATTN